MPYDIFHSYDFDSDEILTDETWKYVASKQVEDSDGFMTDYTWYTDGESHIFIFGDRDIYSPDPDYADWQCETHEEAEEWFNSYNGFAEDDLDLIECGSFSREEFFDTGFETAYGIKTEPEKTLNESYDNLPTWFIKYLESIDGNSTKTVLSKRNIDLKNVSYVEAPPPRSNRDPVLKDANRLNIFRLRSPRMNNEYIYIPSINNPMLYMGQGIFRHAKDLPWKDILEYTYEYGYINLIDPKTYNTAVRNERRAHRMNGVIRGKGQYPVSRNVYGQDKDGNTVVVDKEIKWLTTRGEDKSGYTLDPDKYVKMLDNVGLSNYADRLSNYYTKIENLRERIISLLNRYTIDNSSDYVAANLFSKNIFGDISDAISTLGRAIDYYQEIKQECEKLVGKTLPPEELDERIHYVFEWRAKYFRDYLKQTQETVKKLENPTARQKDI